MRYFKSRENRTAFMIFASAGILFSAAAFSLDALYGILTVVFGAVMTVIHIAVTEIRYKRIAELSDETDRILHGENENFSSDRFEEGELSILQSGICKMVGRIKEQNEHLKEDKIFLSDSIADISHQIKTPLTSVNLMAELLSDPGITEKRKSEVLHELKSMLSRIERLITSLLKISRLDAGTVTFKKENTDIGEFIKKSCEPLLVPMELHGQELVISSDGSFVCDTAWTAEAVLNIVKNCMEHTPQGGRITVSASENPIYTEIVISDSGSGIDEDDLIHIFERFYKGKNSGDGSFGIGLALARMIIAGQNGTVKAENRKDGGAAFTVRFYKGAV